MTYYIKKLDNRHTMKKHGFTHMLEWSNVLNLKLYPTYRKEFDSICRAASKVFGNGWSLYFNNDGKWLSETNVTRNPPRIYFKSEKYISLILIATKNPA